MKIGRIALLMAAVLWCGTADAAAVSARAAEDGRAWHHPTDRSHVSASDFDGYLSTFSDAPPRRYDLRERGGTTPARDQGLENNCWAFAALGAIESSHLLGGGSELDLSERHLVWSATSGSPAFYIPTGANDNIAVALLARWEGPVLERELPYSVTSPSGSPESFRPRLHLEHAYLLDLEYRASYDKSNAAIRKRLVLEHGAISAGIDHRAVTPGSGKCDGATASGCVLGASIVDHQVLICGWDDDWPRDRFPASSRPIANGAWLVKNSYGTSRGESGSFWVSYEDTSLCDGVAYLCGDASKYDVNYGWDELGWTDSIGLSDAPSPNVGHMANVFVSGADVERLRAVAFYTTASSTSCDVAVYTELGDGEIPELNDPAAEVSCVQTFSGYHTVELPAEVVLQPGTRFAVAVRLETPSYSAPIPIEHSVSKTIFYKNASAEPGQSFVSPDGADWSQASVDGKDVNVCVRAFTKSENAPPPPPEPPVDNGGGSGGCTATAPLAALAALLLTSGRIKKTILS